MFSLSRISPYSRLDGASSIFVDGELVFDGIDTPQNLLLLLMGCHYIFNIQYSPKAKNTLEFMQR